jgi:hypothetical protein
MEADTPRAGRIPVTSRDGKYESLHRSDRLQFVRKIRNRSFLLASRLAGLLPGLLSVIVAICL